MQMLQLKTVTWIKNAFFIAIAALIVIAPDLVWEHIRHFLHIAFESFSFLLEELFIHGLGFSKHHAQMSVFYIFMSSLCGLIWWLWHRLPSMLDAIKGYIRLLLLNIRDRAIATWLELSPLQKFQLLIANLIGVWLGTSLLFL